MARANAVTRASIPSSTASQRSRPMPQIGEFTRTKSGYSGRIRTLSLDIELTVVPAELSDAENAPDYRIHLRDEDGPEVGAGWKRTGERAGDYVSLQLDDPVFTQPIRANLFQSGDDKTVWGLHWNRPPKRAERD
jgi:uncharacterized protein (DUF736 family)